MKVPAPWPRVKGKGPGGKWQVGRVVESRIVVAGASARAGHGTLSLSLALLAASLARARDLQRRVSALTAHLQRERSLSLSLARLPSSLPGLPLLPALSLTLLTLTLLSLTLALLPLTLLPLTLLALALLSLTLLARAHNARLLPLSICTKNEPVHARLPLTLLTLLPLPPLLLRGLIASS